MRTHGTRTPAQKRYRIVIGEGRAEATFYAQDQDAAWSRAQALLALRRPVRIVDPAGREIAVRSGGYLIDIGEAPAAFVAENALTAVLKVRAVQALGMEPTVRRRGGGRIDLADLDALARRP